MLVILCETTNYRYFIIYNKVIITESIFVVKIKHILYFINNEIMRT